MILFIKKRSLKILCIVIVNFIPNINCGSIRSDMFIADPQARSNHEYNVDGSQTITSINPDGSHIINHFDTHNKNSSRIKIDVHNQKVASVQFHKDGSQSICMYNPDRSQSINHIDIHGQTLSKTYINPYGYKTCADMDLVTAWHEAGHALSFIKNHSVVLVQHVTIQPDAATKSRGHVKTIHAYHVDFYSNEAENCIISALCGAVAEQVLMSEPMLTNDSQILNLLSQPQYTVDMELAHKNAREIITRNFHYVSELQIKQQIDKIIINSYKKAYQFILRYKYDVQKVANTVLHKKIILCDELYNLLHENKPLIH